MSLTKAFATALIFTITGSAFAGSNLKEVIARKKGDIESNKSSSLKNSCSSKASQKNWTGAVRSPQQRKLALTMARQHPNGRLFIRVS